MKAKHLSGHKSQKEKKWKRNQCLNGKQEKYWLVFMTQKFYYRDIIYDDVATS